MVFVDSKALEPIRLTSPAKINLTLDILGKDERSGKHFVNTILYKDETFFDEIELKPIPEKKNILHCDVNIENNILLKALEALEVTGWEISLWKKIPLESGHGGGSSNAGTILKFFGRRMKSPEHKLLQLAAQLGSDVPFFVLDENLAYFEGFGDQLVSSWDIAPLHIEYVNTGIRVSTPQSYEALDLTECGKDSAKSEALVKSLPLIEARLFHNDFELPFFQKYPQWKGKGHLCGSGGFLWKFNAG